jgi:signal transduction histidine kinase/DNA-binding LacI/PurR family transcriptional regulator/AraC-like DNA-binding protein
MKSDSETSPFQILSTAGKPAERPVIGLLPDTLALSYSYEMWQGVIDAANERDASVVCFSGGRLYPGEKIYPASDKLQRKVLYDLISSENVDGLVVWSIMLGNRIGVTEMRNFCLRYHPLPVVSIEMALEDIPSVMLDDDQGVRALLVHLIKVHNYRRIVFAHTTEKSLVGSGRFRVYTDVLNEYGLFDPSLVLPLRTWQFSSFVSWLLDERKLQPRQDFDAIVAAHDMDAIGIIEALEARHVRVPEEVAVVGFNDMVEARTVTPPLTTVRSPVYEMGKQAAELLLARIAGAATPRRVHLVPQVVVRQSCGCLAPEVKQAATDAKNGRTAPVAFSTPSTLRNERIVAEMTQAVETPTARIDPDWARQILEAFLTELPGRSGRELWTGTASPQVNFLIVLKDVLQQAALRSGELESWQGGISVLRRNLLSHLTPEELPYAESLWQQARVMVSETAQRLQAHQRTHAEQLAERLREISQALTTASDVTELADVLAQELPTLGFTACYLALYENSQAPAEWARLVLAYDERGRVSLEAGGQRFSSRQLTPAGLLPRQRLQNLVVESLFFQENQLGFVILETNQPNSTIFESLRGQVSSALHSVLLTMRNVELYNTAIKAQKMAEEANRLKSRFLSTVSHELRTPLNLIIGMSETVLRESAGDLPSTCQQDLKRIHLSAQHLDRLIRDVLDLASSQVGQLKLVREPLDMTELLRAVAVIGEQMAHDKGLEWRVSIPERLPRVMGDRTRLWQVTLNLISNAAKFTAHGEIALAVEVATNSVTVTVSDTGLGISPSEQLSIFDEFRQSERTASRGYGGLGLGLAISRQLVELHGGAIGVRSAGEEAGSTFFFTLPAIPGSEGTSQQAPVSSRAETVLLLTDRPGSSTVLRQHLAQRGFNVEELGMDPDWLTTVLGNPPGALVLDFLPASERGWELMKIIKENPTTQDIPVLFYSLLHEQDSGSVLELDYLTKPVGPDALARALVRLGLPRRTVPVFLIADDEIDILAMHERMLQAQQPHSRILKASNGKEALEILRREHIDLVLLDLLMPELDGFGVMEAMQADPRLRNVPVMVLTSQVLTENAMARLNQGVAAVLGKGLFSTEETLAQIEATLSRNKKLGSEVQRIVRRAMAYIHQNYSDSITRKEVEDYVGVSESHLTRCFRQEIGMSPMTYLTRFRIRQARSLLDNTHQSVTEIAMATGFSSTAYFSRVFLQEVGVPPSAYRRKHSLASYPAGYSETS